MPKVKITKSVADAAAPRTTSYEIRDSALTGFLLKITPAGRKVFMLAYTTEKGQRRKPAIGRYGAVTVEQARAIAQDWLAAARRGGDPSVERTTARHAPTVKDLCDRYLTDHAIPRNKPSTVRGNKININAHILPAFAGLKVQDISRVEIADLIGKMRHTPTAANLTLSCLRKMFNLAEMWGYRPDSSNPTRHIPKYPQRGRTRLITDLELRRLYLYLDRASTEGLEHPLLLLAIRLQFVFAARRSEILLLEWNWIDFENRRVVWPDSKTGGMSKPLSLEAMQLLAEAPRVAASPYVIPSIFDPQLPMPHHTYSAGWRRILERAKVPHCGTHAIRHRSATDIANSGIPVKVGMALTAHKTVTMFMRYVHTEDDPIRAAAEAVSARRSGVLSPGSDLPASVKSETSTLSLRRDGNLTDTVAYQPRRKRSAARH